MILNPLCPDKFQDIPGPDNLFYVKFRYHTYLFPRVRGHRVTLDNVPHTLNCTDLTACRAGGGICSMENSSSHTYLFPRVRGVRVTYFTCLITSIARQVWFRIMWFYKPHSNSASLSYTRISLTTFQVGGCLGNLNVILVHQYKAYIQHRVSGGYRQPGYSGATNSICLPQLSLYECLVYHNSCYCIKLCGFWLRYYM